MPVRKPAAPSHTAKVNYLRQRLAHTISLSAEKAAAHLQDPSRYPLPPGKDNLEFAFVDLVKVLPKRKQDKFLDKLKEAIQATAPARQQKYGALAAVDFKKAISVAEQADTIAVPEEMKITDADMEAIKLSVKKGKAMAKPVIKRPQLAQAVPGTTLQFTVESITCVETNDRRKDEISVSAFVIDNNGAQQERNNFFTADFKEGESKSPGAAGNLFSFDLADSTSTGFPANFAAGIFMTEKDLIRNNDAAEKVGAILRLAGKIVCTGGTIVFLFVPITLAIGFTVIGVGAALLITGDTLLFFAGDDFSNVATDDLLLETAPLAGDSFSRTVDIEFLKFDAFTTRGKYTAAIRWDVV